MNIHSPLSEFARKIGAALILGAMVANSHGGATNLATEPFTSGGAFKALPNVMFVLDDSGSMNRDYLPDWAGPLRASDLTLAKPLHRFFNGAFNGVAYSPATYYRPPVMYTNTGALDTTTYPSMNGQSVTRGGDATATAGSPNWKSVLQDGYKVQNLFNALAPAPVAPEFFDGTYYRKNLEGNAYSYTTVPGEYCTDEKLRTCTASATPTGIYTFPAKLRWCDTSINARVSTTEAGTRCQAANIADDPAPPPGVTPYTFARMPAPRTATITVTGTGSVTNITVDGLWITSAATVGGGANTATTVATDIALKINACTYGLAGTCTAVGYSATSLAGVVTVTAPGTTSSTPLIFGGTATATAFAAPTSPVSATITVTGTGSITGITTLSGSQILSAPTSVATIATPIITGSITASPAPSTFAGTPNISTFTVTVGGVVNGITVGGAQILSGATSSSGTPRTVATRIAAKINDCTLARTGSCTVGGYSATVPASPSTTVTITAPKPVVTGATTTATTFSTSNIATITVTGFASSVTNVTVGGLRITSVGTGTAGITSNDLMAAAIAAKINACATGLSGSCTVVGYSATSASNVVTITAPSDTTAVATQIAASINACTAALAGACTGPFGYSASSNGNVVTVIAPSTATTGSPTIIGGSATVTAFGYGSVPGANLLTVITPSITSYSFPGTATKAAGRTDCAGTTCTYLEEMTNYANWYAYYRSRMQMMKTAASIAFSSVDDQFRVGYYSINNGAGSEFLNLSAFDGTQKNLWYSKFLNAYPNEQTPLRTALAEVGKLYAGKRTTMNGVAANDPMQYSCQQNFTILSTDGYWNDSTTPTQIDDTTAIGNQDHNDIRPYYDGGTQTLTTSTTWWNDEQWASNTRLFEKRTEQLQTTSSQLDQTVVTKDYYPWTTQATTLQTRTKPLNQTSYDLTEKTYDLTSVSLPLRERTYYIDSTVRILQSYINNLTETTIPLLRTYTNITVTTYPLERATQSPQARITQLQVGTQSPQSRTYQLEVKTETVSKLISALQKKTQTINSTTSQLQKTETFIQSTTKQLQVKDNIYNSFTESWQDTAWTDTSSCTVTPGAVDSTTRNRRCQYAAPVVTGGQTSCAVVAESPGPTTYTVGLARACVYESPSAAATVGTCTVRNASGSFAFTRIQCGYGTAAAPATGLHSCAANDQSASSGTNGATLTGNKVVCDYDAAAWVAAGSCTDNTPASYSGDKISCQFVGGTPTTVSFPLGPTCVNVPQAGPAYTGDRTTCSYADPGWVNAASNTCNPFTPAPAYSANRVTCQYGTPSGYADVGSCTNYSQATTSNMTGDRVQCRHNTTVVWADALPNGSESCTPNTPANFLNPITTCQYSGTGSYTDVGACVARDQTATLGTTGATGDKVECRYNPTVTWAAAPNLPPKTCTPVTPATAYSASLVTCRYNPTASPVGGLANQTTCTPRNQPTTATMTNDGVGCTWDPSGSTNPVASCQWNVPATPVSTKTECAYATTTPPITTATVASCSPAAQSTGSSNGTTWSGPAKTCAYAPAVLTGTNLPNCIAGAPTSVPPAPSYLAYTSCGYINGATTTVSSCTSLPDSTANTYLGPRNACAYQTTFTPADVVSCDAVAQSPTFAAPQKTCVYATSGGTTSTGLTNCTDHPKSTGPGTWTGPFLTCSYAATPVTNATASTCTTMNNASAGPAYINGPKVTCTYNGASVTNNVGACATMPKSTLTADGTVYPTSYSCAYGSFTLWADAAAACVPAAQTGSSPYAGPVRECQYVPLAPPPAAPYPFTATCAPAAQDNTNLTAINCVAGSFPYTVSTVASIVNNCSTAPTSDGGSPVERRTTTTCVYRAPFTVNSATCTPHAQDASSPFAAAITCPVADTGWVPVTASPLATSCTPAGTPGTPPTLFDGTGQIVQCRSSDTTVYNATFPVGNPVAVPSCTWTANPTVTENLATGVQTTCVKPDASVTFPTINMDPVPVNPTTCTPTTTPVAPAYIWTRCNPVTTTATVRGCTAVSPTSPLWETKTCADDGTGTSNTLADVAAYYYKTDLRTPALGNCSGATIPSTGLQGVLCTATKAMNNVPTTNDPLATYQHMKTFTLGLGVSGYMQYSSTYEADALPPSPHGDFYTVKGTPPNLPDNGILADPATGTCAWQSTNLCNWPEPVSDQQTAIDDLWHAGINGRGAYFSATDPTSLSTSIAGALAGVAAQGGSGASPTPSTASVKQGDNYFFNSTYKTVEWTGELVRQQINPVTAEASTAVDWSAQAKLDSKAWTSRAIWTFDNTVPTTKLKAFNSTNFAANSYFLSPHISTAPNGLTQYLCASTSICLSATDQDASHAAGANLVNYLAGDRSNEGIETNNAKYYRQRTHVLGDLVNAQVVYVNKVQYNYADPGYTAYIADQANRVATLYASANDGMLHAFRAKGSTATELLVEAAATAVNAAQLDQSNAAKATDAAAAVAAAEAAVAADTFIGQEIWAYIPTMVFPHLYKLADKKYSTKHRYFVDGSPTSGDICTSACTLGTAIWKTILVGALGRGGRGYYALDITNPASPIALWEFTDANLGYSYGSPQIAKLADGTWVVLVSSGYNNIPNEDGAGGDGVGRLFVLDAVTGTLIRSISTGTGDTTTPSGLAKITAQVTSPDSDNTIEAVYGGDLLGNLWRFDVNNNLGATGFDAQLLATLRDGSGNPQPITTKPQVTSIPTTGEKMVLVGTGSYLDLSDATNTNTQSVYAMKDSRATGGTAGTAIFDNPGGSPRLVGTSTAGFVRQIYTEETCPVGTPTNICAVGELVRTATANPVNFATDNGWFFDLVTTSERANTDLALGLGALVINTNVPSVEACEVGGSSYQYGLNYLTGAAIGATSGSPLSKRVVGKLLANQLASSPTLLMTSSGKLISLTGLAGGGVSINLPALPPGASISRRTSWRELIRE